MILLDLPHYYMKNQMKINFDFNLPTLMYVGMNIASKIVEYLCLPNESPYTFIFFQEFCTPYTSN